MQPNEFSAAAPGKVIKTLQDYWAFVPDPLPPSLEIDWALAAQISEADRALSELAGVARTLPNPHLLIGPFMRREAVLSSRIEGTEASFSDLLFFEAAGISDPRAPDVREVANYVRALEYGLQRLKEFPLSLRLIREMHERLMAGVRGEYLTPGEFRRSQNWIGPPGCTLNEATFVPPPEAEMNHALDEFERYLHASASLPPLVRLALIHYQFEAVHPFLDGNGRIGRLLITLLLCADGLLAEPLLYLSAFFERNRQDYYRYLLAVSQAGQWREWIAFFLRGVADQSRDALRRSSHLLNLRETYRGKLQTVRAPALLLQLTDELFAYPVVTVPQAAKALKVTQRSAQSNINKLIKAGILREITGQQRYRVFIAPEIIRVIDASQID